MHLEFVKVTQLELVHFMDQREKPPRPVIIIYALGEDGIVYEYSGGAWTPFPINPSTIRSGPPPAPPAVRKVKTR